MRTFDYKKVADPSFFRDGCTTPHAHAVHYKDAKEADAGNSSFYFPLNGLWKFHFARNYAETLAGFELPETDCKNWADIRVPSHMQLEGYDRPRYVNKQYPWEGHEAPSPGSIPESYNPVGSFVKYITLSDVKARTFFVMEGAESAAALWVNGRYAGYHEDSFTPAEFEITPYLKKGENKIAVQVFTWSSGSWCEDQDFFRFSGIFRDVYLYTVPETHLEDICVKTVLSEDLREAEILVNVRVQGNGTVRATLSEGGRCLYALNMNGRGGVKKCVFPIMNPRLWSAENPQLYDIALEVFDAEGNLLELVREQAGIRRFEIKDGLLCLNGKRIVFNGVNRHEFTGRNGRVQDVKAMEEALRVMKQNNINAIRTSHYPNHPQLYRLCDRYGLYVIDETNLETHGTWNDADGRHPETALPGNRTAWKKLVLARAQAMYERDKNRPCILMWSCGNEAGGGSVLRDVAEYFRKQDDGRPVQYEGIFEDRTYPETSDVESRMYAPVTEIKSFLKQHRDKPFISAEYAHAMGNSCGALYKYTELAETEPLCQGGFIWDFMDQALWKEDVPGKGYFAYGGAFGDRPNDGAFSGNGLLFADGTVSPKMQEVKFLYQGLKVEVTKKTLKLWNKNLFTDAGAYCCHIVIERDGYPVSEGKTSFSLPPGNRKRFDISRFTDGCELPGEYTVTVSFRLKENTLWAQAGHEVAFGQGVFTVAGELPSVQPARVTDHLRLVESPSVIGVRSMHTSVLFSRENGGLMSYVYGGKELLNGTVQPSFWRAPVSNDYGAGITKEQLQWKSAGILACAQDVPVVEQKKESIDITFTYVLPTIPETTLRVTYSVRTGGVIETTMVLPKKKGLLPPPECGLLYRMPANYSRVSWYGLGPAETYADRKHGARLGRFEGSVKEQMAPYLVPQETGLKYGVRSARVTDLRGRGLRFSMCKDGEPICFSALPYTPAQLEEAMYAHELPKPSHTVVRVLQAQKGVGGDDSWGAKVHPEFLLPDREIRFSFMMQGV